MTNLRELLEAHIAKLEAEAPTAAGPITDDRRVRLLERLMAAAGAGDAKAIGKLRALETLKAKARQPDTMGVSHSIPQPPASPVGGDPPLAPADVRTTEQPTSESADPVVERRSVYIDSPVKPPSGGPYTERELEAMARLHRIAYRPPVPLELQTPSSRFERNGGRGQSSGFAMATRKPQRWS
jgi:hypothetical protein